MSFLTSLLTRPTPPSPRELQIQIQSDLHLEVCTQYSSYTFPQTASILVLAGDVGRLVDYDGYLSFLARQTARFAVVFLVLGNHEFYELTYDEGIETAQRLVREEVLGGKVVLLHQRVWESGEDGVVVEQPKDQDNGEAKDYDNGDGKDKEGERVILTVMGCTLWSHILESAYDIVRYRVSDSRQIREWSPQRHAETHQRESTWLREQVASYRTRVASSSSPHRHALLVVTHHAPCVQGTSRPENALNPWASAYATDLVSGADAASFAGVDAWVFGHTHFSTTLDRGGIQVAANQRGYVFANGVKLEGTRGSDPFKKRRSGGGWMAWRRQDPVEPREFDPAMTISI